MEAVRRANETISEPVDFLHCGFSFILDFELRLWQFRSYNYRAFVHTSISAGVCLRSRWVYYNTVSMFTVNSFTGAPTATAPATVATGILPESMVVDASGKFAYVAIIVSSAADDATISMYTINPITTQRPAF